MEEVLSHRNLYIELSELLNKNHSCSLATVAETNGSTPQKPGSSALFISEGLIRGTVGGGQVEHLIQKVAMNAIEGKISGYYQFDLNDDITDPDPVVCGGEMAVLIDAYPEKHIDTFNELRESYSQRKPGVLISIAIHEKKENYALERIWFNKENQEEVTGRITREITEMAERMLERNKPGDFNKILIENSDTGEDTLVFFESIIPLPELIIAGAGHVGKALSHLGNLLDFEVTVWDDREEYANKQNLPDAAKVLSGKPEDSFTKIRVKKDTFIVIVTRGHRQDSEVLRKFISSGAGYIGMIGSRKKIVQTRQLFIDKGWATEAEWDRIHAPIGLEINSKTVQEIAVSIAAQLVKIRYDLNKRNE